MKRRGFLRLSLGALIGDPLLWAFEKVAPVRYTEALRARFYPGPIRTMDHRRISRPGYWAG
jgi:hypothetical protein